MFWDDWYAELERLDPNDDKWHAADSFVQKVQELIEAKRRQLSCALEESLENLSSCCAEELAYFEITDVLDWSVENLEPGLRPVIAADLCGLREALLEHAAARLATAKTRQEESEKRVTLDSLGETIVGLYKSLSNRLCSTDPEDTSDSEAQSISTIEKPQASPPPTVDGASEHEPNANTEHLEPPSRKRRSRSRKKQRDFRRSLRLRLRCDQDNLDLPINLDDVLMNSDDKDQSLPNESIDSNLDSLVDRILDDTSLASADEVSNNEAGDAIAGDDLSTVVSEAFVPAIDAGGTTEEEHNEADKGGGEVSLESSDTSARTGQLLHKLIVDGDISGAYWLCKSLEKSDEDCPFPSWLFLALETARDNPNRNPAAANDLLRLTTECEVPNSRPCRLLGVASAMHPALTAPQSNTSIWLDSDFEYPAFRRLIEDIKEFSRHSRPISPDVVGRRRGKEELNEAILEAKDNAASWLDNATSHHTKLARANRIWKHLVKRDGEIFSFMQIAVNDDRSQAEDLRQMLGPWKDRGQIVGRIGQIDLDLHGRKVRSIEASPRDQIVSWVFEACSLADQWAQRVSDSETAHSGNTWIDDQVNVLRTGFARNFASAADELQAVVESDDYWLSSAAVCAIGSLRQVAELLQHSGHGLSNTCEQNPVESFVMSQTGSTEQRLRSRLWFLPQLELDSDGLPHPDDETTIANMLHDTLGSEEHIRSVIETRMERCDFRFVERMLETLNESDWKQVNDRYTLLLETSRVSLEAHLSTVEVDIEKEVADGVIMHADRAEYQGILSSISPSEVELFGPEFLKIDRIREDLQIRRRDRLANQQIAWKEKQERLLRNAKGDVGEKILRFVDEALESEDTRVVDECISRLQAAEHETEEPQIDWFQKADLRRDVLNEFLSKCADLESLFNRTSAGVSEILSTLGAKGKLPKPREEEAQKALRAWKKLKQGSSRNPESLCPRVGIVLDFMGLRSNNNDAIDVITPEKDWAHFHANASASGLAQVPQFGSSRNGQYDVVCIWERPGAQTLGARINAAQLAGQPTIVFYLGRMNRSQRSDLARYCKRESLQIIVIDEILLAFLVGERDARLPVALAIALSYSAINPYAPHSAGNVQPEMFFGRHRMNRALQDFGGNGSCLVYGGRQLGKSALLRRVQREFHNPEQHKYAIYEDIRLVGDAMAGQSADELWGLLRNQINRLDLFPGPLTTDQPERLVGRLLDLLKNNANMRILLLLDEADSFLEQDARQQFAIVSRLKRLMEDSGRHFKVVLAGLHNVQRFQGIPNQPFAHLGASLQVGPLSPVAARDLVEKPLEASGYRFSDSSLVLRILSYTNYHPGLIQLFCSKLLDDLHKTASIDGQPPFEISSDDIKTVYSNRKLQQDIRDRFDWTLALDPRYQAITWSIIEDQFEDRDSFARPYSNRDIRDLVTQYWQEGFRGISAENLRGLLDEMCGLGVLVQAEEGYRLRSPNLVHLMGTREDIFTNLFELAERDLKPRVFDADAHHETIDHTRYSPFTHSQARRLAKQSVGTNLVFGSEALGLKNAIDAIRGFLPQDLPSDMGKHASVPDSVTDRNGLFEWLDKFWKHRRKYNRLLVTCPVSASSPVQELTDAALEFCRRHHSSQASWLRVYLIFDAEASWRWMQIPGDTRRSYESRADAVVSLSLWTIEGIRLRLNANQQMDTVAVCEKVESVTGGWPFLLDAFFEQYGTQVDPRPAVEKFDISRDDRRELRLSFLDALGINSVKESVPILQILQSLDEAVEYDFLLELAEGQGIQRELAAVKTQHLLKLGVLEETDDGLRIQEQVYAALGKK